MYVDDTLMDTISTIAFTNLYTISKKTQRIELTGFNWNNHEHITLLHIAKNVKTVFGREIYVEMSWFRWIWTILHHKKYGTIHRLKTPVNEFVPTCGEFIANICKANNCEGIFTNMYERYYK